MIGYTIGATECVVEIEKMPAQSKGSVIQRQWEMLRLIPNHDMPGRSAAELADALAARGYDITRRTVERDLEHLRASMPLAVNERHRPQRWRWQKTRGLDVPGMEAAEAMALYMMRDAMKAHLPSCFMDALQSRFTQADKTLKALARSGDHARWSDRVRIVPAHVVLKPPRIAPRILQTLQRAVLGAIAIDAWYQSLQQAAPEPRLLYPRALLLRGSSLYLIAHQKGPDDAVRHFAVQRFSSVRLKELEPWPTQPFSLDAFMDDGRDQFGEGGPIQFKARISPQLYKILRDSPLSDDMRVVERDGVLTLSATVRDTWALHSWILGHAENVMVLEPAGLKASLSARIQAAAAAYT
jgi:predicted DNA-binding transcriptional regulator YafY